MKATSKAGTICLSLSLISISIACSSQDKGSNAGGGDGDAAAGDGDTANPGSSGGDPGTGGSGLGTGGNSDVLGTGGVGTGGSSPSSGGQAPTGGADSGTGGESSVSESSGCMLPYGGQTDEWVEQPAVNIQGSDRVWSIFMPDGYDPTRAYPLVVLLHGCGSGTNNVPIENSSGSDAILVRGTAADGNCWNAGGDLNLEFFDAMVSGVGAQTCVDEARIFAAGYSSGSWLMSNLGCHRADVVRAVGTVAGGNVLWNTDPGDCNGQVGALFVHDENDEENGIVGSADVRDRLLEQNACGDPDVLMSTPIDPSPCQEYLDCPADNPVVWCATTGEGHSRQDQFAGPLMWDFFSRF